MFYNRLIDRRLFGWASWSAVSKAVNNGTPPFSAVRAHKHVEYWVSGAEFDCRIADSRSEPKVRKTWRNS